MCLCPSGATLVCHKACSELLAITAKNPNQFMVLPSWETICPTQVTVKLLMPVEPFIEATMEGCLLVAFVSVITFYLEFAGPAYI